jgi:Histidine phosphatase superfamily (branch 2)
MYPDPASGGGVLRLHATYRHDLKIKASDEGRVMKTAAAFTKGLLELEGNLTPILASLVTVEEKDRKMLDKGGNDEIKDDMDRCKEHMSSLLQSDAVMTEELAQKVAPNCPKSLKVRHNCLELFTMFSVIKPLALCTMFKSFFHPLILIESGTFYDLFHSPHSTTCTPFYLIHIQFINYILLHILTYAHHYLPFIRPHY